MIFVNFKLYEKTLGDYSLELARICFEVSKMTNVVIIPIVSPFFVKQIYDMTKDKVWIGHVDMYSGGKKTGYISAETAQKVGAAGTLLNHSEHPLPMGTIANTLSIVPEGMQTIVCVKSREQMDRFCKKIRPNFFAYEPPYLISSKTASIATERLEVFEKIVAMAREKGVGVIAGAGVKQKSDVEAVLKVGGQGVLVSSQVVESSDPRSALMDLAGGFAV